MALRTSQLLKLAWRESRTARRRLLLYMSSISLGVASWPKHGENGDDVLSAADRALYESKARGKNRVTLA